MQRFSLPRLKNCGWNNFQYGRLDRYRTGNAKIILNRPCSMTYHLQYQYLRQPGKQRNPKEKNTYILTICCTFVQRLSLSQKKFCVWYSTGLCQMFGLQNANMRKRGTGIFQILGLDILLWHKEVRLSQKLLLCTLHYKEFIADSKLLKGDMLWA